MVFHCYISEILSSTSYHSVFRIEYPWVISKTLEYTDQTFAHQYEICRNGHRRLNHALFQRLTGIFSPTSANIFLPIIQVKCESNCIACNVELIFNQSCYDYCWEGRGDEECDRSRSGRMSSRTVYSSLYSLLWWQFERQSWQKRRLSYYINSRHLCWSFSP